jgi:hypothetical protein
MLTSPICSFLPGARFQRRRGMDTGKSPTVLCARIWSLAQHGWPRMGGGTHLNPFIPSHMQPACHRAHSVKAPPPTLCCGPSVVTNAARGGKAEASGRGTSFRPIGRVLPVSGSNKGHGEGSKFELKSSKVGGIASKVDWPDENRTTYLFVRVGPRKAGTENVLATLVRHSGEGSTIEPFASKLELKTSKVESLVGAAWFEFRTIDASRLEVVGAVSPVIKIRDIGLISDRG